MGEPLNQPTNERPNEMGFLEGYTVHAHVHVQGGEILRNGNVETRKGQDYPVRNRLLGAGAESPDSSLPC